jgi:predicted nucleotidyltransferase component of viral defense system
MNTTRIPLSIRLKRDTHRKMALAQDLIVEEVYKEFPNAVLHGGTAIWRCFQGKRFSEDLDFYLPKDEQLLNQVFDRLARKGFTVKKRKISENSLYSELEITRVSVRLEAIFAQKKGVLSDYETADGNFMSIYSLSAEQFLQEKTSAYLNRRKIRDLWDVYFLLHLPLSFYKISKHLKMLIDSYSAPADEADLKTIITEGITPSSKELISYIKRIWEKKNI